MRALYKEKTTVRAARLMSKKTRIERAAQLLYPPKLVMQKQRSLDQKGKQQLLHKRQFKKHFVMKKEN